MSFANLTGLNIGSSGTLVGKRFTVVGRVVMGMEEEGQVYRWNEFHLVDDANQSVILVNEVTEKGAEWKMFTYVESPNSLTAAEAATKRVGDSVIIDGTTAQVTLVDESKVYFVEGRGPEGVETGDIAKYFNATVDNRMYVVSWTGNEVEIFRGVTLPSHAVASAFNLRQTLRPLGDEPLASEESDQKAVWLRRIVTGLGIAAVLGWFIGKTISCRPSSTSPNISKQAVVPGPIKPPAPAAPLMAGVSGQLWGKPWRIAGHAVVEIRSVGSIYERHEYHLVGADKETALLIYGIEPGKTDWWFLQPGKLDQPLTPVEAAGRRAGHTIYVLGQPMIIHELFMSTVHAAEGDLPPEFASGAVTYGFRAEGKGTVLIARWGETNITCHTGKLLPALEVTTGFGAR